MNHRERKCIVRILTIPILCVSTLAQGQIAEVSHNHSDIYQKNGVLIQPLGGTSPVLLEELGLSPESGQALADIFPLCFRLRNDSTRAIVQITVRYTMLPYGLEPKPAHGTLQLSMLENASRRGWIEPARQLLITPSNNLNRMLSEKRASFDSMRKEVMSESTQFSASRFRQVIVSLDSIAFEDGEVLGPDYFGVTVQQSESEVARRALMEEAVRRLDDLAGLEKWLQGKAAEYRGIDAATGRPDYYRLAQAGFAQGLLVAMKGMTPAQFVERMRTTIPNESKIRLHKTR